MLGLFTKRALIFERKDKDGWKKAKELLKENGIRFASGSYDNEMPPVGCGAKMDPRDYGKMGRIDRLNYEIEVAEEDKERAMQLLQEAGLYDF